MVFALMKKRKRIFAFLVCLVAIFLSGCWDRIETNDLAIVSGTGLDITDDNKLELSVQILNPSALGGQATAGSQSGVQPTIVKKAVGQTLFDARTKLQEKVSRHLFWGHNRVIIIGRELAEAGIQRHFDYFARYPFPRLRAYAFVAEEKAVNVLNIITGFERDSAEFARELANLKIGLSITTKELLQMLSGEAKAVALPILKASQDSDTGLHITGSAVFKKGKMVGQLSDKLTRGLLWVRNEIELSSVTLKPKGEEGLISFKLLDSRTKLVPKIENGKWKMNVNITTNDDIVENETTLNLMNPKIVNRLEKQLEKDIDKRIYQTIEKVQHELETDIFGFAKVFHRHYPEQWAKVKDQWNDKFPEVEIKINTKSYIRRPGRSGPPQGVPKDEVTEE